MKLSFLVLALAVIYLSSCRKKETIPDTLSPQPTAAEYFPLKPGNYWIYEQFETDTNGHTTSLNIFDSVYVYGDTLMNGKTYQMVMDPWNRIYFPDTISYFYFNGDKLTDRTGRVLFSATDSTSELDSASVYWGNLLAYHTSTYMTDMGAVITVKAGSFITVNARTTYIDKSGCTVLRLFPVFDNRYAKGVGKVYERLPGYCSDEKKRHRELLRYHVN